jgi:hypothetical protein
MTKYKNLKQTVLLILGFAFLASCEEMFTTNIFDSLDNLDLSDMSTAEKAGAVLDDTGGAIAGMSQTEIDDLVDDLNDLANDTSASDNTRMQAAAAAAEVGLASTGADDTINSLSDLATGLVNGDTTINDPSDILDNLFSGSSAAEIKAQLDAMVAAASALETYGSILEGGDPPAGVSADSVAITALVVGLVSQSTDSTDDIAAAIVAGTTNTIDLPDMSALTADGGIETIFGADLANTIEGGSMVSTLLDMM